jgi:hypothetical protein
MIHDTLRALLIVAVLAAGCSLLVETRHRLAVIELSTRLAMQPYAVQASTPMPQQEQGRLRQFGQSAINLADATLGIFR